VAAGFVSFSEEEEKTGENDVLQLDSISISVTSEGILG
jgi:preprotein translocase subunit Sec61beta